MHNSETSLLNYIPVILPFELISRGFMSFRNRLSLFWSSPRWSCRWLSAAEVYTAFTGWNCVGPAQTLKGFISATT